MIGLPVHGLAATWWTASTVSGVCSSVACVTAHSSACCESAEPSRLTTIPDISLLFLKGPLSTGGRFWLKRGAVRNASGPNTLHALNRMIYAPSMRAWGHRRETMPGSDRLRWLGAVFEVNDTESSSGRLDTGRPHACGTPGPPHPALRDLEHDRPGHGGRHDLGGRGQVANVGPVELHSIGIGLARQSSGRRMRAGRQLGVAAARDHAAVVRKLRSGPAA